MYNPSLDKTLLAWYPLSSNAQDYGEYGYHGTNNGAVFGTFLGRNCAYFRGSQYIDLGVAWTSKLTSLKNYTLLAFVCQPSSSGTFSSICGRWGDSSDSQQQSSIGLSATNNYITAYINSTSQADNVLTSSTTPSRAKFSCIAATNNFNDSAVGHKEYLDGRIIQTGPMSGTAISSASVGVYNIGCHFTNSSTRSYFFTGYIHNIMAFRKTLTPYEIKLIINFVNGKRKFRIGNLISAQNYAQLKGVGSTKGISTLKF